MSRFHRARDRRSYAAGPALLNRLYCPRMAGGFGADLGALENVASDIVDTLNDLKSRVDSIDGGAGDYGHERLASTVTDFCDR
jgi:hypothetical protein